MYGGKGVLPKFEIIKSILKFDSISKLELFFLIILKFNNSVSI